MIKPVKKIYQMIVQKISYVKNFFHNIIQINLTLIWLFYKICYQIFKKKLLNYNINWYINKNFFYKKNFGFSKIINIIKTLLIKLNREKIL